MIDESLLSYRAIPMFLVASMMAYAFFEHVSDGWEWRRGVTYGGGSMIFFFLAAIYAFGHQRVALRQGSLVVSFGVGPFRRTKSVDASSIVAAYQRSEAEGMRRNRVVVVEIRTREFEHKEFVFGQFLSDEQRRRVLWFIRSNVPGIRTIAAR
jgi:hypothetical protein